jgi:hypothetical protein
MHNNMKPKLSHLIMKWSGVYIFNIIIQFDSFLISKFYIEMYNSLKFQNVFIYYINFKYFK